MAPMAAGDDGLGGTFWLGLVGACIALGIGLLVGFAVIDRAAYRWGFIGALAVLAVVLLVFGWIYDRRQIRNYEQP
jgi:hypothetical protein